MRNSLPILLDANPLTHSLSGVGNVTLSHLEAVAVDDRLYPESWSLSVKPLVTPSPVPHTDISLHQRLSSWFLPWFEKTPAILHGTNAIFPRWMPGLSPRLKVLTIHDVTLLHPRLKSIREKQLLRYHISRSISVADYFFCVSETTRQDLILIQPDAETRSTVVYPDLPDKFFRWMNEKRESRLSTEKPYVLFIGNLNERKNPLALVRGYKQAMAGLTPSFRLIIAGEAGNQWQEIKREASHPDIEIAGYQSDVDLWNLLSGAMALMVPSRYEGFGLQVREAEWLGVPMIVSEIPVFREIFSPSVSWWAESDNSWAEIFSILNKQKLPLKKPQKPTGRPLASRYGDVYLSIC